MDIKYKNKIGIVAVLLMGIFLGWLFFGGNQSVDSHENHSQAHALDTVWTCSMHPQIRQTEEGDCPICGMELIVADQQTSAAHSNVITMSDHALKLANVQTMTVGALEDAGKIQLNGKIAVDERRAYVQSSHIPGRVEQLMINFTGENMRKGQALARIYSPELMTAQKELLQAYSIRESNPMLFEAAKERLRRWKVSAGQIDRIIEQGQPSDQFTIYADVSGVVTDKLVELGDYIDRGEPIYEIANLQKLWVQFDVYERSMGWIKEGSRVSFTVNSLPGETFQGKVSFVDPLLNNQTRVSTARVEIDNKDGRLKPGMFVTGTIEVPKLENQQQLSVPKSAVLWTGQRSIVYVKEQGGFMLRNVVLGSALGDSYVIKEGLETGEEIVVNGTFTVDAAAQLAGKSSMMGAKEHNRHDHGQLLPEKVEEALKISEGTEEELNRLLEAYLELKDALVKDDFSAAKPLTIQFWDALGKVDSEKMDSRAQETWNQVISGLNEVKKMTEATDIESSRSYFEKVSESMIDVFTSYKMEQDTLYVQHCPMAGRDLGANWLSRSKEVLNPYFGSQMLHCGEVVKEIY